MSYNVGTNEREVLIMTGENFIRLNRHDTHLEKMLQDLSSLRGEWGVTYHDYDCDNYFDALYEIEDKIQKLKNCIYTYVYNRNSPNYDYIRAFEKKHLW